MPSDHGLQGRLPVVVCALLLAGLSAVSGCQRPGNKAYQELLNAEKRALEDELYDLAYDCEILQAKVESLKSENAALRGHGGASPETLPPTDSLLPRVAPRSRDDSQSAPAPLRPDGGGAEPSVPDVDEQGLTPPIIETPGPDLSPPETSPPETSPPGTLPPPSTLPPPVTPPPVTPPEGTSATTAGIGRVTHIRLNPLGTGGEDFDGLPGDDGLSVAIEPRGARDELVHRAGAVSIVVIDEALPDDQARVARWDLSADETAQQLGDSHQQPGIRLKLPWPGQRPEHSRLRLFVRYLTDDGRKLEASREFYIAVPGEVANRWTPRSAAARRTTAQRQPQASARNAAPAPAEERASEPPRDTPPNSSQPRPASEDSHSAEPARQAVRPQWRPYR